MTFLKALTSTAIRAIALLLVIAVALLAALVIRPDWFTGAISRITYELSGLEIALQSVETSINPARIEIQSLEINNPDWPQPRLLRLSTLDLTFSDWPAVAAPFWALRIEDAELHIARDDNGRFNWLAREPQQPREPAATGDNPAADSPTPLSLPVDYNFNRVTISNLQVHWHDPGFEESVHLQTLELERVDTGNARFDANLRYQDTPLHFRARVDLDGARNNRIGLTIDATAAGIDVGLDGAVHLAPDLQGTRLALNIAAGDLQQLSTLIRTPLPDVTGVSLRTDFAVNDGYRLENLQLSLAETTLRGEAQTDFALRHVRSRLHSPLLDIDTLMTAFAMPEKTQTVAGETMLPWRDWLRISGHHAVQVDAVRYQHWQIEKAAVNLRHADNITLGATVATVLGGAEPVTGIDLQLTAKPRLDVATGADLDMQLDVESSIGGIAASGPLNVNGRDGTALTLRAAAPDSPALWRLLQQPWSDAGAIRLAGEVSLSTAETAFNAEVTVAAGTLDITGTLRDGAPRQLAATVDGDNLDIRFLSPDSPGTSNTPAQQGPLFDDSAIDFSPLRDIDIDLALSLRNLTTPGPTIRSLSLAPRLTAGRLTAEGALVQFDQGRIEFAFDAATALDVPTVALTIEARDLTGADLNLRPAGDGAGNGRADINLTSAGNSLRKLAANAAGKIDIQISDLSVAAGGLNIIGGDLFNETLNALNPLRDKNPDTKFECIAAAFEGSDGKFTSDKGLLIETDRMKVVGTGHIDLRREQVDLSMSPVAKRGLGVNLSALVQMVKVAGPLHQPGIRANVSGMLNTGLSTTAALSTGGLSMIAEGLIKRAINRGTPCDPTTKPDQFIVEPAEQVPAELAIPMPGHHFPGAQGR